TEGVLTEGRRRRKAAGGARAEDGGAAPATSGAREEADEGGRNLARRERASATGCSDEGNAGLPIDAAMPLEEDVRPEMVWSGGEWQPEGAAMMAVRVVWWSDGSSGGMEERRGCRGTGRRNEAVGDGCTEQRRRE
uniref:Uncharacterized protein n=1 Tax=Oryza glaberrima TaxID=4538 RepID=I1QZ52_ORYGL